MKKTVCILLVLFLCGLCIFANTDCLKYVYENEAFSCVIDAINQNSSYENLHQIYINALNETKNDIVTSLRIKMAYLDYINTIEGKKHKTELKDGLKECYNDLEKLKTSNTIKAVQDLLSFLLHGIDYRIMGNLISGTKALQLIDNLYREYSDDDSVVLLYARRKSQAPKIGGGDSNVAISLLTGLENNMEDKTAAFKFEVLSELAYLYQKSDPTKSRSYSEKAKSLY